MDPLDPYRDLFDIPRRMAQQAEQEAAEALIRARELYRQEAASRAFDVALADRYASRIEGSGDDNFLYSCGISRDR